VLGSSTGVNASQTSLANEGEESDSQQQDSNTDVEGVTSVGANEASRDNFAASSSGFNWWWLLALAALLIISYGVYRFASEESEV
jgi:hypothetical protein